MITIKEVTLSCVNEFWNHHIKYLVEDEIITAEDIDYFTSCEYRGLIEEHMIRPCNPHHLIYFVQNRQNIGACSYCIYFDEGGKCFILDFWIFPQYRGKGIGHQCYQLLEKETKEKGALFYELNSAKEDSIRFWLTNGFVENGIDEYGEKLFIKCL